MELTALTGLIGVVMARVSPEGNFVQLNAFKAGSRISVYVVFQIITTEDSQNSCEEYNHHLSTRYCQILMRPRELVPE